MITAALCDPGWLPRGIIEVTLRERDTNTSLTHTKLPGRKHTSEHIVHRVAATYPSRKWNINLFFLFVIIKQDIVVCLTVCVAPVFNIFL